MTERERLRERERIATLFEAHRKAPGTPYDDSHFLDYLLEAPDKRRAVYHSLAGLRRLNAFIDQVQLEYSIHFSQRDRDANYGIDPFVAKVMELRDSPRASLSSFDARRAGVGWLVVALSNLAVLIPAVVLWRNLTVLAVLGGLLLAINGYWFWTYRRRKRYDHELQRLLMAADDAHRKQAAKARVAGLG
jgi:hypothetical protein